jgi:RNA polymerase sigma-70 factor (ECF subfamily)
MYCNGSECAERFCLYGCLREHEVMVRNLVYHITQNRNDLDDIVQEVLVKVFQSLDAFRGGNFRAYVARITRNYCYDTLRRSKTRNRWSYVDVMANDYPTADSGPEEQLLQKELLSEISRYLDSLSPADREIMILRFVHGFSYDDISDIVGLKSGTVRTRISRARRKIMTLVERRGQHEASELG